MSNPSTSQGFLTLMGCVPGAWIFSGVNFWHRLQVVIWKKNKILESNIALGLKSTVLHSILIAHFARIPLNNSYAQTIINILMSCYGLHKKHVYVYDHIHNVGCLESYISNSTPWRSSHVLHSSHCALQQDCCGTTWRLRVGNQIFWAPTVFLHLVACNTTSCLKVQQWK